MLKFLRRASVGVLICVLVARSANTSAVSITPLKQLSASLPSGAGKVLVFKYCVKCHGPGTTETNLKAERWMEDFWDAVIDAQDMPTLGTYLEANFRPEGVPSEARNKLESFLPPGELKNVVLRKCIACHDAATTRRRLESRAGSRASTWKSILMRMKEYGAPLVDAEIDEVSAYLGSGLASKNVLVEKNALQELYSFLPDGLGGELMMAHCLSCHGASEFKNRIVENSNNDKTYWERVVRRMKDEWEAPLEEDEVSTVITYLTSNFAK